MGICSAKQPHPSERKILKVNKPEFIEQKIEDPKGDKQVQQSQKSPPPSQQSPLSQKSLHNSQLPNPQEPRKSIQSQGVPQLKPKEKPSKLGSSRNVRSGSLRSLNIPNSPLSARGSIVQGVQFFSTNASKKYSLLHNKEQQLNTELRFMQNNKTGKQVRLEMLSKKDEQSIKFIYWLKSNQLDHPHILKNLEVHQDNDWYQVINEYYDGQKLARLMNSEVLSETVLVNIADQMLKVLAHLKSLQLVHGNITINSWEYIFHEKQIDIKLVDIKTFSVKHVDELEGVIYTPPDLIYSSGATNEHDLWSVMICLYILGKGSMPYQISQKQQGDAAAVKQIVLHQALMVEKDITKFSKEFISFLQSVIGSKTQKNRVSLEQLIKNNWLVDNIQKEIPVQTRLLLNMLNQKDTCWIQQVIIEIMVQEFEQETALQLQKMFIEFDSDMDTILQKDELIKMFQKYTKEVNLDDRINQLFQAHQILKPEIQQYTFLSLAAPRDELLTRARLETIFQVLSNNKSEMTAKNITKYLNVTNDELEAQFDELTPEKKLTLDQFIRIMELIK